MAGSADWLSPVPLQCHPPGPKGTSRAKGTYRDPAAVSQSALKSIEPNGSFSEHFSGILNTFFLVLLSVIGLHRCS